MPKPSLLFALVLVAAACTADDTDPTTTDPATTTQTPATEAPATDTTVAPTEPEPGTPDPDEDLPGEVQWGQCPFPAPELAGTAEGDEVVIDCGTLTVMADRDDPSGPEIDLAFAVVRPEGGVLDDDPLVYLGGGPGENSLASISTAFEQVYAPLVTDRELIVLDQRGTGFSQPSLACEEYTQWALEGLGADLSTVDVLEGAAAALDACLDRLTADGIDLAHFNSAASAADLDDLRRALGHEQWNLYGISYGTRLALTAMRDVPDGIRSVVLDAAYPPEVNLYTDTPANLERALDELVATCAADEACTTRFGDLDALLGRAIERLDAEPADVLIVDPANSARIPSEFDGSSLVGFLFQSMYVTELIPLLPEIIDLAAEGDAALAGSILGLFIANAESVSIGMQLAVQCQEEVAFAESDELTEALRDRSRVSGFFELAPTLGPPVFELCERWDAGSPGTDDDQPVTSEIPAIVLAGALDPITPPEWGERTAATLPNSSFHLFPATGHGAVAAHECAAEVVREFLADPTIPPDASCIADIPPPAFTADGLEIELVPVESEMTGASGLRPADWIEVAPGVFQQSVATLLVKQVIPGASTELLVAEVEQLTGEPLEVAEVRTSGELDWQIFELVDLGLRIDLALADGDGDGDGDGVLYLIQLSSTPEQRPVLVDEVFIPVVDGFTP